MPVTRETHVDKLAFLTHLTAVTFEQMPADRMDWIPAPDANSFGHIVRHLAGARVQFARLVSGNESDEERSIDLESFRTQEQLRDLLKRSRDLSLELLGNTDADRFDMLLVGPGGIEMTGHEWAMINLQHEAEHRGNLVVHVKCNDGQPPDIIAVIQDLAAARAESAARDVPEFVDTFPLNAHVRSLHIADGRLAVIFDGEQEIDVEVERVRSLHGARIHHDSYSVSVGSHVIDLATDESVVLEIVHEEHLPMVVALLVEGVEEIWYLQAESFNYRKTLGGEAGYTTRENFDRLVHLLASSFPYASRDVFFEARLANAPLPPPCASLLDFFRSLDASVPVVEK